MAKKNMAKKRRRYWKNSRVEMRAAGFDPEQTAGLAAVVTVASSYTSSYTSAHRCNNRSREIAQRVVQALAAVEEGDTIVISPGARTLDVELSDDEIRRRLSHWAPPESLADIPPGRSEASSRGMSLRLTTLVCNKSSLWWNWAHRNK